jgi:hypothetical protein
MVYIAAMQVAAAGKQQWRRLSATIITGQTKFTRMESNLVRGLKDTLGVKYKIRLPKLECRKLFLNH